MKNSYISNTNNSQSVSVILKKKISIFLFTLKDINFYLSCYYFIIITFSVYNFLEFLSLRFHFLSLLLFRISVTNFFLFKIRSLFFTFYYCYFLLLLKGRIFLIENQFFTLLRILKNIQKNFYFFSLNYQLKLINF